MNESPHWPHAPAHRLGESGTYLVTAATYRKQHFFRDPPRLDGLRNRLLELALEYDWRLEAWAVFSNHYHFIGHSPAANSQNLSLFLSRLHTETAAGINAADQVPERKVWHNYWETRLTYEKSYLARLNYVHQNPVKHQLVTEARCYPWCSASWFEQTATPAQLRTVYAFKTDQLNVFDEFDPIR